jgi:hypothetical protein
MNQMTIMTTGQDVVVMEQELVAKWVMERNATKANDSERFPVVGALLGS